MSLFFNPQPDRTQVWSNGGGTQSTAIAALIVKRRLPKPDVAIMVDTERENSDTFEYFNEWTRPALESVGVNVRIIRKSQYATVDLTSKNGKHILIPAFTYQSGRVGKLPTWCSGEWKRDVITRALRDDGIKHADQWIGFSLDEVKRIKADKRQWLRSIYPLIDLRMNRASCVRSVQEMGWPTPPRSSCWMCPNKGGREWAEMKRERPEDFAKAVAFEQQIRRHDSNMWLHESCQPLDTIDFDVWDASPLSSPNCDSGLCFV